MKLEMMMMMMMMVEIKSKKVMLVEIKNQTTSTRRHNINRNFFKNHISQYETRDDDEE